MSKNLVIGASGQIGEHILHVLREKGQPVIGTYCHHRRQNLQFLDLRDEADVRALFHRIKPSTVYLPAALTNVDYCELHPDLAYEVNVLGTCNVVREANRLKAKIIYFSSDYVFDGLHGPYSESDPAKPLCEYGRQKLISEHYIALQSRDFLIVRTTVVYGWESQGKNFIQRLIVTLRAGEYLRVPMDQVGSPTYAPNLAGAVVELVSTGRTGLFHLVGPRLASRYEFAVAAARTFKLNHNLIEPVPTPALKQPASRPLKAGMLAVKAQNILKTPLVDYEEGLSRMATAKMKGGRIGSR